VGLAALLALSAAPAAGAPPERVEEPVFQIFPDEENGLVVFWNITRDDYCAWEASDFDGDPPVVSLITVTYLTLPTGPVILQSRGVSHLELWTLDEGADLSGPCQDTDDSTEPWATGTAAVTANDNDLDHFVSLEAGLKRTNSFGGGGRGTVTDGDGATHHYSFTFRALGDNTGGFRDVVVHSTLTP
jgi:hypothetical protein